MANEFASAKAQIATVIANVSGIAQAPTNPGETMNIFPFAAIYLADGILSVGPIGTRKSLYNIVIDILTNRIDLAHDLEILNPFIDSIPLALLAEVSDGGDKFSGTISTFRELRMSYISVTDYAGVQMVGYRFIMSDVKILVNTS